MSNPQKAKGDAMELTIAAHLLGRGFDARRTRAGYERDHGDIHLARTAAGPRVIAQCKNHRVIDLAGFLRDTAEQRDAAGAEVGFAVVKRRGVADPGRQYAVLELDWLLDLLDRAGYRVQPDTEGAA